MPSCVCLGVWGLMVHPLFDIPQTEVRGWRGQGTFRIAIRTRKNSRLFFLTPDFSLELLIERSSTGL